MKQLLQNIHNGVTEVVEVPIPQLQAGMALVHTRVHSSQLVLNACWLNLLENPC